MSDREIQINGGWVGLDLALQNGLDPSNHDYKVRQKRGSFKEWLEMKEAERMATGNHMVLAGTMVVYHGGEEDYRGKVAMIQQVDTAYGNHPYRYDLAVIDISWDDEVQVDTVLCWVSRDDFTVISLPELPEPPMVDGYYVSKETGKAFMRQAGKWYFYRTQVEQSHWSELTDWSDENVRNVLTLMRES